jgi:hypothetical protein
MILQTVWNECVRFFVHIDIEISYKILQLKVLKEVPIFAQFTLVFNRGCFDQEHPWSFRGLKKGILVISDIPTMVDLGLQ